MSGQPPLDIADIVSLRVCHPQSIRRRSDILISEMNFSHSLQSGSRREPVIGRVVASKERFLGLATSRILSRHLASFSPTHIAISVSQPAAARFTLAPASGREQDHGRKPRFRRKPHELRGKNVARTAVTRVASGGMRGDNPYSLMQIAVILASRRYRLSSEIMSRMFSNTYEQASVTRAQS